MQPKLYVGNLSYNVSEEELKELFSQYGEVKAVNLIRDQFSGKSKGFAFVEMSSSGEAEKALDAHGKDFQGRSMTVSEARPKNNDRGPRSGGGGGGYSGGGGYNRDRRNY